MSRKVLIAVAVVWAVLVGGAFATFAAVATFSATKLSDESTQIGREIEPYRWKGGPLLLTSQSSKKVVTCVVTPDRGPVRNIDSYKTVRKNHLKLAEPWFSGSATVQCDRAATVRTGTSLKMYQVLHNRGFMIAAAVIAAGPLLAVFLFSSRKKVHQ